MQRTDSRHAAEVVALQRSPLFIVLFTVFVDLIGFGVIIPFLPFYASAVGGGAAILGLIVAAFFAMQFLFSPILGRLSDRVGRRPVILGTLILATAGHLTLSVAGSAFVLLLAARILAGIASGNLSVAQAYIADRTRPEERAKGMGLIGAAFGVGFAVGPVIGGVLEPFGLAAPALAAAALAATNFGLAVLFLPESVTPEMRRSRPAAVRVGPGHHTGPAPIRALRTVRAVVLDFFREFGRVAKRPAIQALLIAFFIVSFAFSTVPVAFPSLGIVSLGLGRQQLVLIFIYIGVINILVGSAAGRLARRTGEERLVAFGTFAIMAGLASVPWVAHWTTYVLLTGVVSMGVAIAFPLIPSLVSKRTPPQEQGTVLGVTQSLGSLARVPGPLVAGYLFDQVGPASPFLFGAALMALGFGITLRVYRDSSQRPSTLSGVSGSVRK
jgi:MFS family permease